MASKHLHGNTLDLTGLRFGRWTVLGYSHATPKHQVYWACRCDCGKERAVMGQNLRRGTSTSCGCAHQEQITALGKSNASHGMTGTRIYIMWKNIKRRCSSDKGKDFKDYKGRGITLCDEWREFEPFMEWALSNGYSDTLTIDRIDNNKGYSPDNCRFATIVEQVRNRRKTVKLTYKGETKPLTEWCEIYGLKKKTVYGRLHDYGWTDPTEILFGKGVAI